VSTFAAAVVRGPSKHWTAVEVDLSGVADVDEVSDRLRDAEPEAEVSVLFVEADDMYLVILRLDDGEDLRVFGSDSAYAEESRLGALLLSDIQEPALEIDDVVGDDDEDDPDGDDESDDEDDEDAATPTVASDTEPVGDADLLADLGVPAHHLLELCGHEHLLPADITAEVCQMMGCADQVEELREA
jgi:putative tRNA adenosine deaminase-associated protein